MGSGTLLKRQINFISSTGTVYIVHQIYFRTCFKHCSFGGLSSIRPRSASVFIPATTSSTALSTGVEGLYSRGRTLSVSDLPQDAADTLGLLLTHDSSQQFHVPVGVFFRVVDPD
jgi:hypothetical protein